MNLKVKRVSAKTVAAFLRGFTAAFVGVQATDVATAAELLDLWQTTQAAFVSGVVFAVLFGVKPSLERVARELEEEADAEAAAQYES